MSVDKDPSEKDEEIKEEAKETKKTKKTAKTFRQMRGTADEKTKTADEADAPKKTSRKRKASVSREELEGDAIQPASIREITSSAKEASDTRASKRSKKKKEETPEAEVTAVEETSSSDAPETSSASDIPDLSDASEVPNVTEAETDGEDEEDAFDPEVFPKMSRSERFGTRVKVITVWLLRRLWYRIKSIQMTDTRMIAVSVLGVMLVGALLLCTPFASASGEWTSFVDALFTATTSTCVTGLVTVTTAAHWSLFGQIVILVMIQVGGIGFMTVLTLLSFFMHRKISMHERKLLQQSVGSINRSGVTGTFLQILLGTFVIEGIGAALLAIRFYPMYGNKGIWYAVFHSISAFCNAGIDILSVEGTSLISFADDYLVTGTIMFLVIMGGLGFLVWNDILRCGIHFKKMKLHSKMVLTLTFSLIAGGTVLLFLTERNAAFAGMSVGEKWWASLFQSVTLRTAGFATVDQAFLSNSGTMLCLILMFIGGSPGSTAGGVKTTTMSVFFISILRLSRNREDVVLFKKRIDNRIVRQAGAVVGVYLGMVLVATMLICALEPMGIREVLFEVVSAVATVGLSMNITPTFCTASKLILIVLMYAGRLGGLSLFLALGERTEAAVLERPTEKILIG